MVLSNKTYDILKWVTSLALPLCTFVTTICTIYGLPYGDKIVGTIAAVNTLLGYIVKKSSDNYEGDGTLIVGDDTAVLAMTETNLTERDSVMVKVVAPAHMKTEE